jgi:hypothetical protein
VASLLDELLETFEIAAHASARDFDTIRPPSGKTSPHQETPQVPCHAAAWRTRGKRAMHQRFGVELTRPGLQLRR